MSVRLFLAVHVGADVVGRLDATLARLRPMAPGAKWVAPDSAHLTLVFLGPVAEERSAGVMRALEDVAARHAPLVLRVRGGGAFGSSKRPRVLWLGVEGDVERLGAAQRDLATALTPLGFTPEERPFSPHLTLARARDPRGDPALAECVRDLAGTDLGEAHVDSLVLYRSDLSRAGPRYTAISRAPLTGDRGDR